jgi:carboxyl-terminal processing protease
VFVDVFEGGPAATAGIVSGDVLIAVDGRECSDSETPQFGIGARHQLTFKRAGRSKREVFVEVPVRKPTTARPPIVEPKPLSFRVLDTGVGLLRIVYFPGAFGMRFGRELDAVMQKIRSAACRHLVLDLRGNIGGSLGFARVASYLCPDIVPIGHSLTPQRLRSGYIPDELPKVVMPAGRFNLLTTLTRFAFADKSIMLMTSGFGLQPFHGRLVVLVNEWTNSAGEMLAAFAQQHIGAQVIGERTRGNVLGAANFSVGGGYWLRFPVFGWYTAQGHSLEGAGVIPDIQVPPLQLMRGIDDQLMAAERVVKDGRY